MSSKKMIELKVWPAYNTKLYLMGNIGECGVFITPKSTLTKSVNIC